MPLSGATSPVKYHSQVPLSLPNATPLPGARCDSQVPLPGDRCDSQVSLSLPSATPRCHSQVVAAAAAVPSGELRLCSELREQLQLK